MKCILLCAGYATRLFPLTENFPKALLDIKEGKPLLDYTMDQINQIDQIDEIFLITNDRYYNHFLEWSKKFNKKPITVFNDHTSSNDDRLGAIGDIQYTINQAKIDDDVIIIAGDNLFDYPLQEVVDYYNTKKASIVCGKELDNIEQLKKFAVAILDDNDKIINLEEKPANPKSNIAIYATYIYPKNIVKSIRNYLEEGNNPDAPGYFVEYLYKVKDVFVYRFKGNCYDVGTFEQLDVVRKIYNN